MYIPAEIIGYFMPSVSVKDVDNDILDGVCDGLCRYRVKGARATTIADAFKLGGIE